MTDQERNERIAQIEPLLEAARKAQTKFWDSLSALEDEVGIPLSIDNFDLQDMSAEDLLDDAEAQEKQEGFEFEDDCECEEES